MYTLQQTIGVKKGINQRWEIIDISQAPMSSLYDLYRKLFFKLSVLDQTKYLDLYELPLQTRSLQMTFAEFLTQNADNTLPTIDALPHLNTVTAKYKDAYRAGYKITPWSALYAANVEVSERDSALLTRTSPVTDYSHFRNHCLVTVNGFFHLIDTNGVDGVLVYDALKSVRLSNQNTIGIWSFQRVSALSYLPISSSMMYKIDSAQSFNQDTYLDLGVDISNKFILVCIGGYLHWMDDDGFITKVSDTRIKLNMRSYPYVERYYQSKHYIDLSGLSTGAQNEQVDLNVLKSDDNVRKLMELSQSFVVIFDKKELFVNSYFVKKNKIPGLYTSFVKPEHPLMVGLGRCPEYWVDKEDQQYAIKVTANVVSNLIYKSVNQTVNGIDSTQLPTDSEHVAAARLIEIGSDI